ncbi:MAG: hypothetical protein FWF75_10405, partial [Propionibacteriaceae bacterium]|nr:hypothetical protein [Propionibacteriaceae bacterium]
VSLDTASGDQCVLKFTFIKWAYGSLLERRNEFRTVIERTVLQIDPGAEIATSMNKLENGLLKGVGGMLDVALHNAMADSQGDQLNFTSLADLYQSAPAFREHWN